jgi:hypothetical protein
MNVGRFVWFATVLVVLAGYVTVIRAGEQRIAEQRALAAEIGARFEAEEVRLRNAATAAGTRARLGRRVHRFVFEGDEAALVARFVHDAARIATLDRLRIVTIAADPALGLDAQAPATTPNAFAATPLDVTLEGSYGDVLRGVRDLSTGHVLARVAVDGMMRSHRDGPGGGVTATLHVLVERLRTKEETGDRAGRA